MSLSIPPARKSQIGLVFPVLGLIVAIALGGTILTHQFFSGIVFKNEVLHTFLEATAAVSALTLTLMIMLSKNGEQDASLAFVTAAGLISMCVLDSMHSLVPPGNLFVWLRSNSTLIGGFFFASTWVTPNHWLARSGPRVVLGVIGLILMFGLASFIYAPSLPTMIEHGTFTALAEAINFIGGLFFLSASARYYLLHKSSHQLKDLFYIGLCLLLGISGLLFSWSTLWHIDWWFWHILRLLAYFFVLGHLLLLMQEGNRALHQSASELASSVNARTRELAHTNSLLAFENQKLLQSDQEKERVMASLRASEERWAFALEGSGDGVWDWDMVQGRLQLSVRWKEIFGYQHDEIGDAPSDWFALIHADDLADVMATIEANQDGMSRSFSSEHRMRHKDGHYVWVLARGMVVLRDEQGLPLRIIGTHTDISDRKQIERMKSAFISTVSHELRTPLTSIRASLGLLENGVLGQLPPKALDLVKVASKNSVRLISLVNDILDMDKLLSGQMTIHADPVDLCKLVAQSIEVNASYATSFKVQYKLASGPETCIVIGDENRLMQVMTNLLSNAAKFSKPEQNVEVRILPQGSVVRVEIEDHGNGIAPEFQSRIFEEFAQANSTNTRHSGGTGLGLNITKKLLEKMAGQIGYDTRIGEGTTFWFMLPISVRHTARD
jgi:PAS domain S-box-containing protein